MDIFISRDIKNGPFMMSSFRASVSHQHCTSGESIITFTGQHNDGSTLITSHVTLVWWAPPVSISSLFIYHQRRLIKILIAHISMSLILILWFLTSLDLRLSKKGSLSFPWQACRLLLVLFNSPKLHAFLFLALRLEPNEMPLTNIPGWFPARADVGSFMPVDFRRLIAISRPPDSSGIKSHFSNLSIWGWTRKKKSWSEWIKERDCKMEG